MILNEVKPIKKLARDIDKSDRAKFIQELPYMNWYEGKDFRKNPELYKIGRGEQGVLMAKPYKTEIGQHWRFATPEIAKKSADKIYAMFLHYLDVKDFPGADMARKFLQMGFTRSRRYANHKNGVKYDKNKELIPQEKDHLTSIKAQSAQVFKEVYDKARVHPEYLKQKELHKQIEKEQEK